MQRLRVQTSDALYGLNDRGVLRVRRKGRADEFFALTAPPTSGWTV